jgi:Holliday junction resolvase-like predicted endonuclease
LNPDAHKQVVKAILAKTQSGEATLDEVRESVNVTREAFNQTVEEMAEDGAITLDGDAVKLSTEQRVRLAVRAVELGADFQTVSGSLGWLEFEELVAHVFEENGFNVQRRYRFQAEGRRWEIDVLACRSPYIVCAECKHYTKGMGNSAARNIVETHLEKTEVFSRHLPGQAKKIGIHRWRDALMVPITLTLSPTEMRIYRRMPSVSVLALTSFLASFEGYLERMTYFRVELPEWKPKPRQTRLR